MTQNEKDEITRSVNEKQLELLSTMAKSDAHAAKCIKLGLNFAEEYPEEYQEYISAREEYNLNESYLEQVEAMPIDEDEHLPIDEPQTV